MEFNLSEEQLLIKQSAKEFAEQVLLPEVISRDENQSFPTKELKNLAELGFFGMMVDEKYGGAGVDTISYSLAIQEIAKIDAAIAVILSVNNSLVCGCLENYGSDEQKQKYLIPLAQGKSLGAFCLSEPDSGSDAKNLDTSAVEENNYFLMNGTKNWITSGKNADYYIVFASENKSLRHKGINAFIVDKNWDGVSQGPKENKLGLRSSDTCSVMFENVKVPKENMIGKRGQGFNIAMSLLEIGRIGIASQCLGIATGALERTIQYSKERTAFGKEIYKFQANSFKLADMATKVESAKALTLKAAWEKDHGLDFLYSSSIAKEYSSRIALENSIDAVQIHGGYGCVKDYHVERMFRDSKVTQIYEGTTEIQKLIIGRQLLK